MCICYKGVRVVGDIVRWAVSSGSPDGVTVTPAGNVVVAVRDAGHLIVFTPTGQVVKDVKLPAELVKPRHAFQLENEQFLLCHGWGNEAYGIHVVDSNGRVVKSATSPSSTASKLPGPRSFTPTHLALDRHGNVLMAEFSGNTVRLYNRRLEYVGDVVMESAGLKLPFRLCVDEASRRLYVGEYTHGARVLVFDR